MSTNLAEQAISRSNPLVLIEGGKEVAEPAVQPEGDVQYVDQILAEKNPGYQPVELPERMTESKVALAVYEAKINAELKAKLFVNPDFQELPQLPTWMSDNDIRLFLGAQAFLFKNNQHYSEIDYLTKICDSVSWKTKYIAFLKVIKNNSSFRLGKNDGDLGLQILQHFILNADKCTEIELEQIYMGINFFESFKGLTLESLVAGKTSLNIFYQIEAMVNNYAKLRYGKNGVDTNSAVMISLAGYLWDLYSSN